MTFEEAFRRHLATVDALYGEWFAIIADPQFLNRGNSQWINADKRLKDAVDMTFRLKDAWMESGEVPMITKGRKA